jgi:biopolymer transport protein ExbB/TolQ
MSIKKRAILILIAVVLVVFFHQFVRLVANPGDRLFDFFFARSFVQYLTLFTFAYTLILLSDRFVHYLHNKKELQNAVKFKKDWQLHGGILAEQLKVLNETLVKNGISGVIPQIRKQQAQLKQETSRVYEAINALVCLLPALGLFGTVLGLSNSLFTAFSGNAVGSEAIRKFVGALAIALDTTVLGLACSIIAGICVRLMVRLEEVLCEYREKFLRQLLHLDKLAHSSPAVAAGATNAIQPAADIDVFRTELRAITNEIVSHIKMSLEGFWVGMANKQFKYNQAAIDKVADSIASRLNNTISKLTVVVEKHNNHTAKVFAAQVRTLEHSINRRIPNEVIVRYEHNGHTAPEANDGE